MSVQIIVDSAADFEAADIERYGLRIVSLKTIFSDGEYVEGQNLTRQGFYEKLEASGEIPKTCQATPFDFERAYKEVLERGDTAVVITMSEKLSGTATGICLVFLSAPLTGLAVYDDIAKFAGAGTLVPITGFANSIVAPAVEFKTEGVVLGTCAKMFTIAGPVLVFGTVASAIYGLIYWVCLLLQ